MVVRHGEAFTISDFLTVWEDGRAVYRPTVHYAYCPCDAAMASLQEMRGYNYHLQPKLRIMNDEITSGSDILGALLMGHAYNAWWTGSDLSIEESRRLVPHQNATTMQVAISVVAAVLWMIANPRRGVCLPEQLPHDFILKIARPYLGNNACRCRPIGRRCGTSTSTLPELVRSAIRFRRSLAVQEFSYRGGDVMRQFKNVLLVSVVECRQFVGWVMSETHIGFSRISVGLSLDPPYRCFHNRHLLAVEGT